MVLKLFYDLLSQPARACFVFLKVADIPFLPCPIALRKLEQRSDAFTAMTPIQKVPVIDEDGFVLTESSAILKYLSLRYKVPAHWYPANDLKRQARIDEYLHWHHANTRLDVSSYFRTRVVKPLSSGGLPIDRREVITSEKKLVETAKLFETYFLDKTPFISSQEISVADIQALMEFMQPLAGGFDIFAERPALAAWRSRVEPKLQPAFEETHKMLFTLAKRVQDYETNHPML